MLRWEAGLVVLVAATVVVGSQMSSRFLLSGNFFYIGLNIGEIAIMAIPVTLIVITGEIDLSVTSMLELSGVLMGWLFAHGWPIELAMLAALCAGAMAGAFNGFLVTRLGLPSMIVTIGTLTLYEGIGQILLPQTSVGGFPTALTDIGIFPIPHTQIPYSVGFFIVIAAGAAVVLHKTPLGRAIYAIGTNRQAAYFSGIRVKRVKMGLFITSGLLSSLCGILWTFRFASARYDMATGLELNVVAIVFFAGTAFTGGKGSVLGVVLAAAIFAGIQDALTLDLVSAQSQNIVIGGLLIGSVLIPSVADVYRRTGDSLRALAQRYRPGVPFGDGASTGGFAAAPDMTVRRAPGADGLPDENTGAR
jgi:rhamnose transport system permease protein